MSDWKQEVDEIVYDGKICVPYSWTVGATLSHWYGELRDNGEIWANRCSKCDKVFVPPKKKCIYCYGDNSEWVKLPGTGTIETFTVVYYSEPAHQPKEPPIIYAVIKMDEADNGMVHLIDEIDPDKVEIGMRVEAVLKEDRVGELKDIKYFKPI